MLQELREQASQEASGCVTGERSAWHPRGSMVFGSASDGNGRRGGFLGKRKRVSQKGSERVPGVSGNSNTLI